jgi:hypothetical protein
MIERRINPAERETETGDGKLEKDVEREEQSGKWRYPLRKQQGGRARSLPN